MFPDINKSNQTKTQLTKTLASLTPTLSSEVNAMLPGPSYNAAEVTHDQMTMTNTMD